MSTRDKRVDEYIAKSPDFAKPILTHVREIVHKTCPDVTETLKWRFPSFEYKGMFCGIGSFKEHCMFGFWKSTIMKDPNKALKQMGCMKTMKELPSDKILVAYIKEAMKLNDDGVKLVRKPVSKEKKELITPEYLTKALSKNKKAKATFDGFSYSNKKEYIEWLTEAKTEETRLKRLETAIEWMAEGKVRNWKYIKK